MPSIFSIFGSINKNFRLFWWEFEYEIFAQILIYIKNFWQKVRIILNGRIDVGNGCWRQNVLVITIKCFITMSPTSLSPFWTSEWPAVHRTQRYFLFHVYVIWMPFDCPKLLRNPFHKRANDHYPSYIRITQPARQGAPVIKACSYEDVVSKARPHQSNSLRELFFIWKEPWSMPFLATHHFLRQLFVSVDSGWSLL